MRPTVYMMLGLPGSGKTTFSKELQNRLGIQRFSIDEEYARRGGSLQDPRWDKEIASEAGAYIKRLTAELVAGNQSVILDLCPWIKNKRQEYRAYINDIGAICHIYYFEVDKHELLRRLTARNQSSEEAYVITPEMLDDFIEEFDAPLDEEVELVACGETTNNLLR